MKTNDDLKEGIGCSFTIIYIGIAFLLFAIGANSIEIAKIIWK